MPQHPTICLPGYPDQTSNYQKSLNIHHYQIDLPLKHYSVFELYHNSFAIYQACARCDLLLLPGGGDIDPSFYRQSAANVQNVDFMLDNIQFRFLDAFIQAGKPVIGICKGMQLINIYFGGDLQQNMCPCSLQKHAYTDQDQYHSIHPVCTHTTTSWHTCFPADSPLIRTITVNSAHHQAVSRIGQGLYVLQTATDQIVETICHKTLPVIGTQWHPERLFVHGKDQLFPILQMFL